jgi:hypothetical protein
LAATLATSISLGVAAIARPAGAHAFAWKDTCTFELYNNTGSVGNVRPTLYGPLPPNPVAISLYLVLAATGVPSGSILTNTGIPLTDGCAAGVQFTNPGDNVSCSARAPTVGANSFNCSGNASFKIVTDDDDIKGRVYFPKGSGVPAARASAVSARTAATTLPRASAGLLRRGDLAGRGWRKATKLSDFGRLGQLVAADSLPAGCRGSNKARRQVPKKGGSSAFVRRSGSEAVGVVHGVYATAARSRTTLNDAVSDHSIGCLARLLTSARYRTRVTIQRLSVPGADAVVKLRRLVVRTRPHGRTDYVDVVGLRHGRSNALVLFANAGRPIGNAAELAVLRTVARRLP